MAYFISETVESLDLSAFYSRYEGDGRRNQPFDPRMMVKVILYGYATGCTSSRRVAMRTSPPRLRIANWARPTTRRTAVRP